LTLKPRHVGGGAVDVVDGGCERVQVSLARFADTVFVNVLSADWLALPFTVYRIGQCGHRVRECVLSVVWLALVLTVVVSVVRAVLSALFVFKFATSLAIVKVLVLSV